MINDHLIDIFLLHFELVDTVFQGNYGSERENKLEEELAYLRLIMQKIEEANFKWRQAQVMVEYACRQIGTAVEKWKEIMKLPMTWDFYSLLLSSQFNCGSFNILYMEIDNYI